MEQLFVFGSLLGVVLVFIVLSMGPQQNRVDRSELDVDNVMETERAPSAIPDVPIVELVASRMETPFAKSEVSGMSGITLVGDLACLEVIYNKNILYSKYCNTGGSLVANQLPAELLLCFRGGNHPGRLLKGVSYQANGAWL